MMIPDETMAPVAAEAIEEKTQHSQQTIIPIAQKMGNTRAFAREAAHVAQRYPVFPCKPNKAPYTRHGYQDATQDPAQIARWAAQWPDALIGVPTGAVSGLLVLDVDVDPAKGKDGFAALAAAGVALPDTRKHMTRRGGAHYLLNYPLWADKMGSTTDAGGMAGVDVRGDGGYVIWWPACGGAVENPQTYAEVPGWLDDALQAGRPAKAAADAPGADDWMADEPPVGITLDEAKAKLAYVDNQDYDTWLKVGMSLHHEFGGSPDALALWDEWSATASNYIDGDDLAHRWGGFDKSGHRPVTARWLLKVGNAGEREAVRVEKRAALDDAKAIIRACEDSIDLLGDVARRVGLAAGNDIALRTELIGLIRARYKELTGGIVLPVADARVAMGDGQPVVPFNQRRRSMTEFGNAERMLDRYGDGLMYVPEIDAWYSWTGVYWRRVAAVALEHLAKETIRALLDEAQAIESDDERAAFLKHCSVSQRAVMVRNMVSLAQSDPRVVVGVADLDSTPHLLGVGNGVVDLRNGSLLPPDPVYRVTVITDVEYDPAAVCPLFEQTVADVFFGDAEMIGFFQRLVGYSLLAQPREDVLAIPYGSGSNGKSTVLGAVRDVLGGHAKMASADTFLSSGTGGGNAGGPREDILRLRGARFVYVSEPDAGSVLREGLVKSMTGGESLPARGIHAKATVEVQPTWVAFMPTNHLPTVPSDDHAIWRRLMPVPFTRNFDQDEAVTKDPGRAEKLAAEAPGILAWCVRGAIAYQREGLQPPGRVQQAREAYKGDMDVLAEWMESCCEVGPNFVETNTALWNSWETWARLSGGKLRLVSSRDAMGRRLDAKGFVSIKDTAGIRGRGRLGLRVRRADGFDE